MDAGEAPPSSGLGWRLSATIMVLAGWFAFAILWLAFYASGYNIYQNLAVFLSSLVILGAVLGVLWAGFGARMRRMYGRDQYWPGPGPGRQGRWIRRIIWLVWVVVLIAWLLFYADGFSGYQNLAVFIASLLIAGGLATVVRLAWGR